MREEQPSWTEKVARWTAKEIAAGALQALLFSSPFLAGLFSAAIASREQVPVLGIIIVGVFVAAMAALALNQARSFVFSQSVDWALVPGNFEVTNFVNGQTKALDGYQVGLMLFNKSTKPLRFKVKSIHCSVEGRIAKTPVYENDGGTVFPLHDTMYKAAMVPMDGAKFSTPMAGEFKIEIVYGKKMPLRHTLTLSRRFLLDVNSDGVASNIRWFSKD